jgi:predicted NBD/HSP70 family sugar kinase
MHILVVDVGGTNVNLLASGSAERLKIPSGHTLTPAGMVAAVRAATQDWAYDVVSVGVPAPVRDGRVAREPHNLGPGWVDFDFAAAFGRPTRVVNDAAMQALGSYDGGRLLFLGLGTGLGSALVVEGIVQPLELAHLPYRHGHSFEEYVGTPALERFGRRRWRRFVADVTARLVAALQADDVVLGGGNAKYLDTLPCGARRGTNANAFTGGFRLWEAARGTPGTPVPVTGSGDPAATG